ncbi:lipoprotein [Archangium violaceum Cb vi76]|uniref:Lipoprotein n=1 Tax=Archangium violaceum Cb vi76 TaxID=1406225 RepID=A0A084SL10_9BACT|nr:lipoprotein [Archangium violaceum Cb vi76]
MWVACAVLGGCQLDPSVQTGTEVINMRIPLTGDVCGVVSASAAVSAVDMTPIGPVSLTVADAAITGSITSVPAGAGRKVQVNAYNSAGLEVYAGSTEVIVEAGKTVSANITLYRNTRNCPLTTPTGTIDITGTLDTGSPPTDGGTPSDGGVVVLEGTDYAFTFNDVALSSNGVVHFLDGTNDKVRRLDLTTQRFLPAFAGTGDAVSMAVAPDGSATYLGYTGGRIDAFNPVDATSRFFGAAPETASSLLVTGDYLFTVDGSGSWDSHSLYQRSTGARVATADWRYSSRAMVFSPINKRVYHLDSGVSPTDVRMVQVDHIAGTMGTETDSPYHGSYSLPNPLRLLPDESGVIVGSGLIFNTRDLTYRTSIGLTFQDIAFHGDRLYIIDTVGETTQLRVLSSTFDILSAAYYQGTAKRVFAYNGQLVLITQNKTGGGLRVHLIPL